jgi:hypothetical protein
MHLTLEVTVADGDLLTRAETARQPNDSGAAAGSMIVPLLTVV